jgi:prepilin-type N-terminal cleavage/methylation domain-containing protein
MGNKAFTLIELLVVVAIIGILAAVGVVAYNGYTGAAKSVAIKSQHKNISKFIQYELTKCSMGESFIEFKETLGQKKWNCDYGNDWSTVSQLSQGFSRYFQYQSAYRGSPKNILTGKNACCIGYGAQDNAPGNHAIGAVAQGTMSFSDWVKAGSPNKIIITTFLIDGSKLQTEIVKGW